MRSIARQTQLANVAINTTALAADQSGSVSSVAVSNAHDTVAGGVLVRPFAQLISNAGDSVTTYGEPWNMQ